MGRQFIKGGALIIVIWMVSVTCGKAFSADVSCNYAVNGNSTTIKPCVVINEKYYGFLQLEMNVSYEPAAYGTISIVPNSLHGTITWSDGQTTNLPSNFGFPYVVHCYSATLPSDGMICSPTREWSTQPNNFQYGISYSCEHSADCFPTRGSTVLAQDTGFHVSPDKILVPPGQLANGSFSFSISSTNDIPMNCQGVSTINNSSSGHVSMTCTTIPLGITFNQHLFSPSDGGELISVDGHYRFNGAVADTATISVSGGGGGEVTRAIPYTIAYAARSCIDTAMYKDMGAFVFDENNSSDYVLHSPYGVDSATVRLVPKKSLTECTHNVFSYPGGDAYAKNYFKLNVISNSASCPSGIKSSMDVKKSDNNVDTIIDWTISGLKNQISGSQVKCSNSITTTLTWY